MGINLDRILAFDIETAPAEENFSEESLFWDTWSNKHRKHNFTNEELIEEYYKTAGLHGEYNVIVCISAGFLHKGVFRLKSFTGSEKEIITDFLEMVERFVATRGDVKFLGHNIGNFDIPVLRMAFSKYFPLFTYPDYLSDVDFHSLQGKKPWNVKNIIDTLSIQKGLRFSFSSMAETALSLGLPSPKIDTDGSKVGELFRKGGIEKIRTYCEGDVYTSFSIWCKWVGEEIPEKKIITEDIERPSILKRGIVSSELSDEATDKLSKVISELTKEEQVIANDIVTAVTSKTKIQKKKNYGK